MTKKQIGFDYGALDGIVRTIKKPASKKILQEVCIGKKKYRKNKVFGTYNSVDNNQVLLETQLNKVRLCK